MKILHVVGARPNFMKMALIASDVNSAATCTLVLP
jgi:UDP-N-acetylglucosamine 2-epimerase